jgi:septal ring factor EnvC (AmiA/AmiB activator)
MDTFAKSESIRSINKKLKSCDPEIKNYVRYLKKENAKLHRKLAKMEVENLTLKNRVVALEIERKKLHKNISPSETLIEELRIELDSKSRNVKSLPSDPL